MDQGTPAELPFDLWETHILLPHCPLPMCQLTLILFLLSPHRPKQVSNQTLESQSPPHLAATPNHLESPFILFQKEELPYFSLPRNPERLQI